MMYLVEGRNLKETRGQYVLTKESAYAILEEMKQDFQKVNIYEKTNGEYKRIEKWERKQTNEEWFATLNDKEKEDALYHLFFYEVQTALVDKRLLAKLVMKWLKQPHTQKE